jgi:hypothetical protein
MDQVKSVAILTQSVVDLEKSVMDGVKSFVGVTLTEIVVG